MQVPGIFLYSGTDPIRLHAYATDLSKVGYFHRNTVLQFLKFTTRTIAQRVTSGGNLYVEVEHELPYVVHSHRESSGGWCLCLVTERDYPMPVAQRWLRKLLESYVGASLGIGPEPSKEDEEFRDLIKEAQDPAKIDKLSKITQQLEEIKAITLQNISQVIARGESLDSLMQKSDDLSRNSKIFAGEAKRL